MPFPIDIPAGAVGHDNLARPYGPDAGDYYSSITSTSPPGAVTSGGRGWVRVRAVAFYNVTPSGSQEVEPGLTVAPGERVLLIGQDDPTENRPFIVSADAWTPISENPDDWRLVLVDEGAQAETMFALTTDGVIVPGTTALAWTFLRAGLAPYWYEALTYGSSFPPVQHFTSTNPTAYSPPAGPATVNGVAVGTNELAMWWTGSDAGFWLTNHNVVGGVPEPWTPVLWPTTILGRPGPVWVLDGVSNVGKAMIHSDRLTAITGEDFVEIPINYTAIRTGTAGFTIPNRAGGGVGLLPLTSGGTDTEASPFVEFTGTVTARVKVPGFVVIGLIADATMPAGFVGQVYAEAVVRSSAGTILRTVRMALPDMPAARPNAVCGRRRVRVDDPTDTIEIAISHTNPGPTPIAFTVNAWEIEISDGGRI